MGGPSRFKGLIWTRDDSSAAFDKLHAMYRKYQWSYYHAGLEHAPTTGTEHLDFYYEYDGQRRLSTERNKFKKVFGSGNFSLEPAKGTAGENQDYSSKEQGRYVEHGTPSIGQGKDSSWDTLKDQLSKGEVTTDDLCVSDPVRYHQYGRTMHKLEDIFLRKRFRTEMTTCEWLYGPTGVGKSHRALSDYNPDTHYLWKQSDKGWQDGYTGQPIVIINEFRGSIPYPDLLELIDKWPITLPRRGREPVPFLAKHIIITSSLHPSKIYSRQLEKDDSINQLLRRVTVTFVESRDSPGSEV